MPNWSNDPPSEPQRYALAILRTPATKPIDAIITSPDLIGCYTHFVHNRTVPCEGVNDCNHCKEGHSLRWHAYLSCLVVDGLQHCLFESTARAAEQFVAYRDHYRTLRSCRFVAWRPSKKPNSRVQIKCKRHDDADSPLPPPPDVKAILCHMWNIQRQGGTEHTDPERRVAIFTPAKTNGDGRYTSLDRTEK